MTERLIVSLTTWSARIANIPAVLDTIIYQTIKPDLIVLNLARGERIPEHIQKYIVDNKIEVNFIEDTKVYKKLIPTLSKYPDDLVVSIDDDWLYPPTMLEDFIKTHNEFPGNPISGNKVRHSGIQCHCGCASLTAKCFFGSFFEMIDKDVIHNCKSDDIVYTYFARKNGLDYVTTSGLYYENMDGINQVNSYSDSNRFIIERSLDYLKNRFDKCRITDNRINLTGPELLVRLDVKNHYQLPYFISKLQNITNCRITLSVLSDYQDESCIEIAIRSFQKVNYSNFEHLAADGFDYVLDLNSVSFDDVPQEYTFDFRNEIQWRDAVTDTFLYDDATLSRAFSKATDHPLCVFGGNAVLFSPMSRKGSETIKPVKRKSLSKRLAEVPKLLLSTYFFGTERQKYLVILGKSYKIKGRVSLSTLINLLFVRENDI